MSLKIAKNLLRECKALKKNIIAVDPGSKYIGLALANFEQNYVEMTPLGHITQTTKAQDLEQLRKHINDHNVGGLIIGDPIVGKYDEIGEGLRRLDVTEAKSLLQCSRDHGINFFDNAEVYANGRAEEIMGQAIRELGWKRSDIVVSTKIFWGGQGPNDKGLSRKHIVKGTKASLKRLDMDYVDVIYFRRPDTSTPIEETVRAMNYIYLKKKTIIVLGIGLVKRTKEAFNASSSSCLFDYLLTSAATQVPCKNSSSSSSSSYQQQLTTAVRWQQGSTVTAATVDSRLVKDEQQQQQQRGRDSSGEGS
ncbi:hypothetical protein WN944_010794 [Citrus x changshan-huyou]|uniref:NADP-dependent oxidoreductase domain-containing protein n=1 Tax=Citrus x changshan-huyou TaxID=2935761 RepID=A0AAP0R0Y6_9ROSI